MEGPTPVSALIHAATLVTLGVLLFIRVNVSTSLLIVVIILLLFTSVCVLLLGLSLDIKKSIAYSTIVQLLFALVITQFYLHSLCFIYLIVHAIYKSTALCVCDCSTCFIYSGF
jgi:NADH:ubiquinone oxidoreductase subunit 5 (subunit L)/multisubunit Na+/H+ antiporter MnhA subunit